MNATESRISELVNARLGSWLRRAEQALMAEKTRVLKPYGLTVSQYAALHALSIAALSGAQLARICCVTPQSTASMLAGLEARGLIARVPSEVHQVVLITTLTSAGRELFEQADAAALGVEARLSATFSHEEDEQLRTALARAIDTLESGQAKRKASDGPRQRKAHT